MQKTLLILCTLVFSLSSIKAQYAGGQLGPDILEAILTGDSDAFSPIVDRRTDYVQGANFIVSSPTQILIQLKDFFRQHPCSSVRVLNQGASKDFAFVRTDYKDISGQTFWITLFVRAKRISRIKIERQ